MPINRKYPIRELLAACLRYIEKAPRDFVMFEYVMLDGVNDSVAQARAARQRSFGGVPCKINLIPFNPFPGTGYARSGPAAVARFRDVLMEADLSRPCARRAATTSMPRAASSRVRCRTGPGARSAAHEETAR